MYERLDTQNLQIMHI